MHVPLTTADFADRARTVYADRLGAVDEPTAAGSLGRLTYGQLMARADGMVAALERAGIGPGERVAIVSPNATKLLIALYAVTGSGRILVPINFRLKAAEVAYIVADCGAALLFLDPELDLKLKAVKVPLKVLLDGERDGEWFAPVAAAELRPWPQVSEDAAATINYTSGTTSTPKGVVLSHRSHWLNATAVGFGFGLTAADRYLHTLPIFHVNGWGLPLICAALGVPQIIQREVRGEEILRRVSAEAITLLCGAAPVAQAIEQAARVLTAGGAPVPGAGHTRMVSGGAPTPAAVIESFEQTTGWEMIHAYGLTETGPVLTANRVLPSENLGADQRAQRLASAGAPLLGVKLAIDADGQLLARAAKAMSCYWQRPDESAETLRDGWVYTGDGGKLKDGNLTITDRIKDIIVSGGENIASLKIEAVLYRHPDIIDAAVIAAAHPRWGETPKAFVVLRDGAAVEEAEIIAFCRQHLAAFQCPSSVEQVDDLPRTATGKIQKYRLRAAEHGG